LKAAGRILVTGASGQVGLAVLRALSAAGARPIALVRGRAAGTAELRALSELGLVEAIWADLEAPGLGLSARTRRRLEREVTEVVHVAAHYRLSATGAQVAANVAGLRNLAACARTWTLRSFHHVSSIGVAGRSRGDIPETLLPRPASFRNPYEESKWQVEQDLVALLAVPTRIYRLGIVVGDSATGETGKLDGPYAAFGLLRRWMPFFIPGRGREQFPLVSRDLASDVLVAGLADPPDGLEVLHVVDTGAPTVRGFAEAMARRLAGHRRVIGLPSWLLRAIARAPGFERATGLEPIAVEYMATGARFRVDRFRAFCARHRLAPARVADGCDALALYYALATGRRFAGAAP